MRAVRGGSWYATVGSCSAKTRGEGRADNATVNTVGFRVAADRKDSGEHTQTGEIVSVNTELINSGENILIYSVIKNITDKESQPMDIIAALYYNSIMIDVESCHNITVPVNCEISKRFELNCSQKYQEDKSKLKVKLFYWRMPQMSPIREITELNIEEPFSNVKKINWNL